MSEISFPFRSSGGDRKYQVTAWTDFFTAIYNDGIIPEGDELSVEPDSGMDVILNTGFAIIQGASYHNTTPIIFTLDPADGILDRIDSIILRRSLDNREITAEYLKGTPGASPSAPTLTQDVEDDYEYARVDIAVDAGVTEITAGDITDNLTLGTRCQYATVRLDIGATVFQAQMLNLIAYLEQEIADAEGGTLFDLKPIVEEDITIDTADFVSYTASGDAETNLYDAGYTLRAAVPITGVIIGMRPYLTFDTTTVDSTGVVIPNQFLAYNGGVYVYSNDTPANDIIILTAEIRKGVS